MPYILLLIGLLFGAVALYRFFMKANIEQIKALLLVLASLALITALFFMAITGRLPAAIALIGALVPFVFGFLKQRKIKPNEDAEQDGQEELSTSPRDERSAIKTRAEALEILGLESKASAEEIEAAHKALMRKVHPDAQGSAWMAAKLNQARDILLKRS